MDREYIIRDGGAKDRSIAIWIQTASQYFDLRIPSDRPTLAGRRSLADFSRDELAQLARQSGDTGICSIENNVATWKSWGDRFGFSCADVAVFPEDGRLEPRGDVIYETETASCPFRYEEAWVRQPERCGLVAHLTLRAEPHADDVLAVLLVVGSYAGYVERATSDDRLGLETQLARAQGDVARMRAILACEASYAVRAHGGAGGAAAGGLVSDAAGIAVGGAPIGAAVGNAPGGAGFRIRHSNLPFREGEWLDVPPLDAASLERCTSFPAKRERARWHVESWFVRGELGSEGAA